MNCLVSFVQHQSPSLMKFIKISICLLFASFLILLACNSKEKSVNAKIRITKSTQPNVAVTLSQFKYLEQEIIKESMTDSLGQCNLDVSQLKPEFVSIQIGGKYSQIYLEPDFDLAITERGKDYQIPLLFSGKGAEINNYISFVNSTIEKIKWLRGKGIIELSNEQFRSRVDSLKQVINQYHEHYMDSVDLPDKTVDMLLSRNKIKFIGIGQEYKFYNLNSAMNRKWEALRKGEKFKETHVSLELDNLVDKMPIDTTLLEYIEYKEALNFYWHTAIRMPVYDKVGPDGLHNPLQLMTNDIIRKAEFPKPIREVLMALDLQYWFAALGITPETDSVFNDFKRSFGYSNYLPGLEKTYSEWLAVSPGSLAPDFTGNTIDGTEVSLSSLKGKVVYIDVWATWCKPCVAEIPFSKKLQKEFEGNKGVEFLNVSVDNKSELWKSFLQEDQDWGGLHLNLRGENIQAFYKNL